MVFLSQNYYYFSVPKTYTMLFCVYILFSEKLNKHYIGTTDDIERRVKEHNSKFYENNYTSSGIPWQMVFNISCQSSSQAYKIEKHIKAMHSKIFIQNLIKYPEMSQKLLDRYKDL